MEKIILLISAFILFIGLLSYSTNVVTSNAPSAVTNTVTSIQKDDSTNYYNNIEYNISFSYNKDWKANTQYDNGFFHVNAFNGKSMEIDEVASVEINHKLKPYGSDPQITSLIIQGQEARLIMPSDDQPEGFDNQAELIIKYPKAVEINGSTYYYLILYADKNYIETIAKTIEFIS